MIRPWTLDTPPAGSPTTPSSPPRSAPPGWRRLAACPRELREALAAIPDDRIDTPYRDGGWTGRQVVHHVADSHINAYIRFRLALTESGPVVKPYEESVWAELLDAKTEPPSVSVGILEGLHRRLHVLLASLGPEDFARTATSSGRMARSPWTGCCRCTPGTGVITSDT